MMLLVWSLGSLFQGFMYLLENISERIYMLSSPNLAGIFLQEVLVFPLGLSIVILVADYIIMGRIVKRHGIELLATVIIGALSRVARPLVDISLWFQGGLSWTRLVFWVSIPQNVVSAIIADSYVSILLVLCMYLAKRVLTNRSILSSGIILLLAANYLWMGLDWLWINLIQPSLETVSNPFYTQPWYAQASVLMEAGANLIFAIFLLHIYLRLRHTNYLGISAPSYLRGFFIFYGVFSVFYRIVSYSTYQGSIWYYPLLTVVGILGDLAIILVTAYPPRLTLHGDGSDDLSRGD